MKTPDFVRAARPANTLTWPLRAIDQYALQWVIQGTWVLDADLDCAALKYGLAKLLEHYPMLCGRIAGANRIEWREKGVPVVEETDTALSVRDFGPAQVEATRFHHRFSPASIRLGAAPLLTVKLTHLRDGCVLGICASHACLDGNGFYTLVQNLSRCVAGVDFPPPTFEYPVGQRSSRSNTEVRRAARQAGWFRITLIDLLSAAIARPRMLDRVFVAHFSAATLRRGQEFLASAAGQSRLSNNSALLAHIAHCVTCLIGLDRRDSFALSVAVDQRGRLPQLSETFAGNAVAAVTTAPIPAGATREDIAACVHERLEPMLARPSAALAATVSLTGEVMARRLPFSPILGRTFLRLRRALLYTNSFARFPVYDLDFGTPAHPIRPVRVIPHNLGDPILVWPAPAQVGGVEVYFSGALARAVGRLAKDDPWWIQLRRFCD